jgi:hypothetical protein
MRITLPDPCPGKGQKTGPLHAATRAYTRRTWRTNGLSEPQQALLVSYIQNNRSYNSRQALMHANMQIHKFILRKIPQTCKYLHLSTDFSNSLPCLFLPMSMHFFCPRSALWLQGMSVTVARLLCIITAVSRCPLHFDSILARFLPRRKVNSFLNCTRRAGNISHRYLSNGALPIEG